MLWLNFKYGKSRVVSIVLLPYSNVILSVCYSWSRSPLLNALYLLYTCIFVSALAFIFMSSHRKTNAKTWIHYLKSPQFLPTKEMSEPFWHGSDVWFDSGSFNFNLYPFPPPKPYFISIIKIEYFISVLTPMSAHARSLISSKENVKNKTSYTIPNKFVEFSLVVKVNKSSYKFAVKGRRLALFVRLVK